MLDKAVFIVIFCVIDGYFWWNRSPERYAKWGIKLLEKNDLTKIVFDDNIF
jgi:hypothetical protein